MEMNSFQTALEAACFFLTVSAMCLGKHVVAKLFAFSDDKHLFTYYISSISYITCDIWE